MNTAEIAARLVVLCREAKWEAAQRELFSETAISVESRPGPAFDQETKGLAAIIAKGRKFESMIEKVHSLEVSEPLVAGDAIACTMSMDVTMKGQDRMTMSELCVYQVKDGKIVSERFFM